MLSDPISITVNTVAKSMPRILSEGTHSVYKMSDLTFSLDVKHRSVTRDKKKRVVSTVAFTERKVVADPLTAVNDYDTMTSSVQFDRPEIGWTATEVNNNFAGLAAWMTSTIVGKIVGQES